MEFTLRWEKANSCLYTFQPPDVVLEGQRELKHTSIPCVEAELASHWGGIDTMTGAVMMVHYLHTDQQV